ncbi:MAG TPA: FAD-dependent oxidoreductase, partial [Steroidobacteraceae bacterium]|nr:FAD-dependent oxidoreductase [Steroidobacteraceae bacterium]
IFLEVHELVADAKLANRLRIDKVPATALLAGEKDFGIRFYGLTAGYEFGSLLEDIEMIASGRPELEAEVEQLVARISVPTHLEILVTLTCPYCPSMVRLAHQLAFLNENVRADMIDAGEFPALVERYQVQGVPRTVINERPAFEGAMLPASAVMAILKEVDRETYERLDAARREARGERLAHDATPREEYDVIVVGAGPAGLSAALYAARKNRRVALIGKRAGGQINDTAVIENYLGMSRVGGGELADLFRRHVESYSVAERCHSEVRKVRRGGAGFEVETSDGQTFRGRAIVYAAGKVYRRLGVPGEDRFIGRGVAFCATCDAPLFRGRKVAVVGGGNSALTAVRDLVAFASEIHLVHALETFQADPALVEEVHRAKNVTVHLRTEVREFLGRERLEGLRVVSKERPPGYDLPVDGVFLEIGLAPNSAAVRELLAVNGAGEIPVARDQATAVPGLFAAGDVTDERDKQIIIAAGAGARAALSADRYLAGRNQQSPRVRLEGVA